MPPGRCCTAQWPGRHPFRSALVSGVDATDLRLARLVRGEPELVVRQAAAVGALAGLGSERREDAPTEDRLAARGAGSEATRLPRFVDSRTVGERCRSS